MEVRKGYQQTDVGVIPDDWEVKKIYEFTEVTTGGTPSTFNHGYWGGDIKWMNSGELSLKKINNVEGRITKLGLKNSSTKVIPSFCVLVGLAGQGKTRGTVAMNMIDLCINQSIAAIYPSICVLTYYLYYNLDSRYTELRNISSGEGGRGGLNLRTIKNLVIPFPLNPAEQTAIANALSDIDSLIASLEKLIAKKQSIKQGTMQELLTGKKRLPGFKGEWEVKTLGEISFIVTGSTPTTKDKSNYGNEYLFVSPIDLGKGKYIKDAEKKLSKKGFDNSRKYPKNSILFTCIGSTIGKSGISNIEMTSNQQINTILPSDNFNVDYLYYYLNLLSPKIKAFASEQAIPIINKSEFEKIEILFPSKKEQTAIAQILSDMDSEIEAVEKKLAKYRAIKQGMMQELLTGRIRLI